MDLSLENEMNVVNKKQDSSSSSYSSSSSSSSSSSGSSTESTSSSSSDTSESSDDEEEGTLEAKQQRAQQRLSQFSSNMPIRGRGVRTRGGSFTALNRFGYYNLKKTNVSTSGINKKRGRPRGSLSRSSHKTIRQQQPQYSTSDLYQTKTIKQSTSKIVPLKLVLKRENNNNYQIKSSSARPRRQAATKVKFVFSEDEQESSAISHENTPKKPMYSYQIQKPQLNYSIQKRPIFQNKKFKAAPKTPSVEKFTSNEIVDQTIEEKMLIVCKQPNVLINHSKPFPIALVEDGTNVVFTKALLLNHLFLSYNSPCILCPLCKTFLNVYEFTRHLHDIDLMDVSCDSSDNDDERIDERQSKINSILKHKKFNILPYQTANNPLTELDMNIWRQFGKLYTKFKQERLMKRNRQLQMNKPIQSKMKKSKTCLQTSSEIILNDYSNWDYVTKSKDIYILNKSRLDNENCILVEQASSVVFDRLKNVNTKDEDLILSEDEDDLMNCSDAGGGGEDVDKARFVKLKNTLKQLPSIQKRYFNLYDNLSFEILLYMCDNQYTIIPVSYIEYINSKREQIFEASRSAFIQNFIKL